MSVTASNIVSITHNQGMDWLIEVRQMVSKQKAVNLFLASLSARKLGLRSGLSAFALAAHMKRHYWEPSEGKDICPYCCDYGVTDTLGKDLGLINSFRLGNGVIPPFDNGVVTLAFYLDQLYRSEPAVPDNVDIGIITAIIKIINEADDRDGPNQLERKISKLKVFKSNKEERRGLIETLGYCGILETNEHKGYFMHYNDFVTREQRPRGAKKNDWAYPVRFWKGKDGINEVALKYWFGHEE